MVRSLRVSAGSHPKPLHPNAVRVMRDRGIDISRRRSKHSSEFADRRFDYVITLCDRVREVCPEFPGVPEPIHWSVPDPAREPAGTTRRCPPSSAPPPSWRPGSASSSRAINATRQEETQHA